MADPQKADRAAYYNQHLRNPEARRFYNSAAWKRTRDECIRQHPICERCNRVTADHVHHRIPLASCTEAQKLDPSNLQSVCRACHNAIEARTEAPAPETPIGTIKIVEDDQYYFDEQAADGPRRFFRKYFKHYEGRFDSQPFELLAWQAEQVIRPLFGWKRRDNKLRRFRELYLITGKSAGKTPLLTMIGLWMALADGEAAPHVVSMASSFEQAGLTFNAAKFYLDGSELSRHPQIGPKQHKIELPRNGQWTVVSGKNKGRSGTRPTCVLADEIHEFDRQAVENFSIVTANLFKRSQPLLIVATNAAADRSGFPWEIHERACKTLLDPMSNPTLLPVIYEAPKALDWRSEDAARAANPSIPDIVTFDQIQPEQAKGEARYRRLFLSQWVTGSDKWLDLDRWKECEQPLDLDAIKGAPRYVGLDLSNGDDLCACVDIFPTSTAYHVASKFWIPKATAERYEQTDLHPYHEWADTGAITLLDESTISIAVQQRIAQHVIAEHARHPITAVCYDRAYSSGVIPIIEAAGIECRPVPQGWTVSQGCQELDRRLIEHSISIDPNAVLRFCAENVEIKYDERGNYWPIKPHARGRYAGRRSAKIDGISALVTGLTEARKHEFQKTAPYVSVEMIDL